MVSRGGRAADRACPRPIGGATAGAHPNGARIRAPWGDPVAPGVVRSGGRAVSYHRGDVAPPSRPCPAPDRWRVPRDLAWARRGGAVRRIAPRLGLWEPGPRRLRPRGHGPRPARDRGRGGRRRGALPTGQTAHPSRELAGAPRGGPPAPHGALAARARAPA